MDETIHIDLQGSRADGCAPLEPYVGLLAKRN
jgi:hypothetical protein